MSSDSSSQLEHLKSLVAQLQTKIERLESQASSSARSAVDSVKETVTETVGGVKQQLTPAQHLRLVLMGPPGAGQSLLSLLSLTWGRN